MEILLLIYAMACRQGPFSSSDRSNQSIYGQHSRTQKIMEDEEQQQQQHRSGERRKYCGGGGDGGTSKWAITPKFIHSVHITYTCTHREMVLSVHYGHLAHFNPNASAASMGGTSSSSSLPCHSAMLLLAQGRNVWPSSRKLIRTREKYYFIYYTGFPFAPQLRSYTLYPPRGLGLDFW